MWRGYCLANQYIYMSLLCVCGRLMFMSRVRMSYRLVESPVFSRVSYHVRNLFIVDKVYSLAPLIPRLYYFCIVKFKNVFDNCR